MEPVGAKVTGTGSNSLLTDKEVAKSKYVHQAAADVLFRLMKKAYDDESNKDKKDFNSWRAEMENSNPLFQCLSTYRAKTRDGFAPVHKVYSISQA